ncbi:MAG TPA: pitrilysin family protein [Beijerinckiaceae bacterium]|jgi:zinc protease
MTSAAAILSASPAKVGQVLSPGGVEAWHVHSDVVPLVALAFTFEGGAAQDPKDKAGAAQMLARLLDEGAGPYTSDAFQERLAARAIELSFNAGPDAVGGSLKTLVRHADEAFELLRLALSSPRFDEDAIERVRAQTIAGLRYQQNDPGVMASRRFFAEAFPDHPYGHPTGGTIESVSAITRADLLDLHARVIADGREKIAAVGAIEPGGLAAALDGVFGALPAAGLAEPVPSARIAGRGTRHVVDIDVPQSVIRFGTEGVSWRDPDFIAAYVLNHILGGGAFTSRLFQEVREKRGLAYSVGTSLVSYRGAAMTWGYTATKNERVAECLTVIEAEMARLKDEGPSDEELQKAKDYLTGSYALGFDTSTKIAHQLAQVAFEGLGIDYIARRNGLVAAVTQDDIRRAAERTLGDGRLLVVVAGRPVGL